MRFKKTDEDQRLVFGEVYIPGVPDSQGDVASAETVRNMAYDFIMSGRINEFDIQHEGDNVAVSVVESFIARDSDDLFIPGAWVLGVKVHDDAVWEMVKSGELNGFSLEGEGHRNTLEIEVDVPREVAGRTAITAGHSHGFKVLYSEEGKFLGGRTDIVDGHRHNIIRGTATEEADGHTHRYAFVGLRVNL